MISERVRTRAFRAGLAASLLALAASAHAADAVTLTWAKDLDDAKRQAATDRKLVMLFVTNEADEKCRKAKELLSSVAELKDVILLNIEAEKDQTWKTLFRPKNEAPLPVLIFTDSDGKQWGSANGPLGKETVAGAVKEALAKRRKASEPPPDQKTERKTDKKTDRKTEKKT